MESAPRNSRHWILIYYTEYGVTFYWAWFGWFIRECDHFRFASLDDARNTLNGRPETCRPFLTIYEVDEHGSYSEV